MLINLNDETWKYNMNVVVDNSSATKDENRYNIGGYNILIKCRGKVINKLCLPDLGSMIEAIFKETTKEKLLDNGDRWENILDANIKADNIHR